MIRISRTASQALVALTLALGAPALLAPEIADAQVVVRPGRGAVVVQPAPGRPGGAVVVQPGPGRGRPGAVVVAPEHGRDRDGHVVDRGHADPGHGGGAVVVTPGQDRHGHATDPGHAGAVVVTPGRPGGAVIVGPRGVVRGAPGRVVVVGPPPAPRVMTRRPPPSRHGELWVEPYWGWTGNQWEWIDGHWEVPPQSGAIWVAPQWDGSGWVPGYWTMASVYQQAPQVVGMAYQVGAYTSGQLTDRDPRDTSGGAYQDYAVWMNAGEIATFLVSGGPSDRYAGTRVDVAMTLLLDQRPIASANPSGPFDMQLTFSAPRAAIYTLRISTRGGPAGTGQYILQSAQGQWAPQQSPYDQYWGGQVQVQPTYPQQQYPQQQQQQYPQQQQQQYPQQQYPQQQYPQVPDCRSTLLQMGHAATNLMFCDGNIEPYCADTLLRMGHAPTNLMFCQGVQAQCATQLLQSGRSPTELQFCR